MHNASLQSLRFCGEASRLTQEVIISLRVAFARSVLGGFAWTAVRGPRHPCLATQPNLGYDLKSIVPFALET